MRSAISHFLCSPHHVLTGSSDSEEDSESDGGKVLAATMQFMPGHFACDVVWRTSFVIHPRLKTTASRPGGSISAGD